MGVLEGRTRPPALVDAGHHSPAGPPPRAPGPAAPDASAISLQEPGLRGRRAVGRGGRRGRDLVGALVAVDGRIEVRHHAHPPAGLFGAAPGGRPSASTSGGVMGLVPGAERAGRRGRARGSTRRSGRAARRRAARRGPG